MPDLRQTLTIGESRGAGLLLDYLPQGFGQQFGDLAARPLSIVDLGEPILDDRYQLERGSQWSHRLFAAQQRRGDDGLHGNRTQTIHHAAGLGLPLLVQLDPWAAPGRVCATFDVDRPWRNRMTVMMRSPLPRPTGPSPRGPGSRGSPRTNTCCGY